MMRSSNIRYEMASILYNIAALHSQLGIEEDRSDPESMKIACTHFQCAAWAFGEMKTQYSLVLRSDLSAELMIFMQQISFAQAQECILEKSLADNRKAAIIAKVTAQVISFYNAALSATFSQVEEGTIQDLVGNKLYKDWLRYIKFKTSYLSSILFLYQGMNSEEQRKMGERVALYNAACDKLEEAKKESKGMNKIEVINEALVFATDIIEGKRKNAKQENEFIYHENIPEISSISAVQGANLVQGIPFDVADPQVIGDDIFKRLVPMKTHEHLSVYSEEKANILRSLGGKIDERDAELSSFMGSLNTESLNAMGNSQEKLPQGLVDRCAELSAKPSAIPSLVDSMSNLADICCDVEVTLKDIKRILDDESKQEQNYQKQMGKRPTGHMTELTREYTKYFEAHNKAGESNDTLRKAMELHVSNLKILAQPLSSLKAQIPQADPIDDITRKELSTLLNKVEEMKKQRDGIFNELREQILNKDDITAQLITHGDKDVEELFKKELKKYSQSVSIIEQNLVAQGNILKALTDTYAKHAMTLKSFNDTKLKREQFYSSLIASFDVYEDLMSKSAKGLDFYKKLHGNVQKLMSRMKAARDVQEEERQQLLKNALPKAPPVESIKPIDTSYRSSSDYKHAAPTSTGGPKLKDYLKSGMVPGMGGLRDELNKLPGVRPSPVGQENIPTPNPASCPSMNYPGNNYRNPQAYGSDQSYPAPQQIPYYPSADQRSVHSGSASLSSSSTSLNNDYYNQGSGYTMNAGNQGYVNPIYQSTGQPNYTDMSASGYSQVDAKNYSTNSYQQPPTGINQYGAYAANYGQQQQQHQVAPAVQQQPQQVAPAVQQQPQSPANQQFDYYKRQSPSIQQPTVSSSSDASAQHHNINYSHQSYMNPTSALQQPQTSIDPTQNIYQYQQMPQQYQNPAMNPQQQASSQYPATASPSLNTQQQVQYPTAASPSLNVQQQQQPYQAPLNQLNYPQTPAAQQYSQYQSPQQSPAPVQNQPQVSQSPAPSQVSNNQQQYSMNQSETNQNFSGNQSQQDFANQQNYYSMNQNQSFMVNPYTQYGEKKFSQQNYSCYTPTMNTTSSYMTAGDTIAAQSQTTQSTGYSNSQEVINAVTGHVNNQTSHDSPLRTPHAIPTYSAAVNATSMANANTHSTQSQQQVFSTAEKETPAAAPTPVAPVKSENVDLLSGIDFTMANPTIDNIPTLTPMSVKKSVDESPQKVLVPQSSVAAIASTPVKLNEDLADLDFASISSAPEPVRVQEIKKQKLLENPFDEIAILKQFHKEVEGLEKIMETLTVKTMNGVTPLANKWKELQDLLVKDESKRSVSIARLFPDKNRSIDCLPYDHARVSLSTSTDNYINAVVVKDCGPVSFVLTQTPMSNTVGDYWEMVWSQKSKTLVCLHSSNEVSFDAKALR